MRIGSETLLRTVLRMRPAAAKVLEAAAGSACWLALDSTLGEFCAEEKLDPSVVAARIIDLPVAPAGSPWEELPLDLLLDRLTADHERFRRIDLPEIEESLSAADPADYPHGYPLEDLRLKFHSFKIDFLLHMEEEESFLFPHVLRDEAASRRPDLPPEIFRGSASAYGRTMLRTPEVEIRTMAEDLERVAASSPADASTPASEGLMARFRLLADALKKHADLETDTLLPMALRVEKGLAARSRSEGEMRETRSWGESQCGF